MQLREFKERLRQEEEQELQNAQTQADSQIKEFQQELQMKLVSEKRDISNRFDKIKAQVQ